MPQTTVLDLPQEEQSRDAGCAASCRVWGPPGLAGTLGWTADEDGTLAAAVRTTILMLCLGGRWVASSRRLPAPMVGAGRTGVARRWPRSWPPNTAGSGNGPS